MNLLVRRVRALVEVDTPRRRDRELAAALRTIAATVRSGQSLQAAFAEAGARGRGSVARAMRAAGAELGIGLGVEQVAARLADRTGGDSARLFADVLAVQHRRGGDLGTLCLRLARLLHERGRLDQEARSATAQARFTARAVVVLPAVIAVGWAWLSPRTFHELLTPAMLLLAAPAAIALGIGIAVLRALARSAVSLEPRQPADAVDGRVTGRLIARVAGQGSLREQATRLASVAALVFALVAISGARSSLLVVCGAGAIGCALAWPVLRARRDRQLLVEAAAAGLPTLLELSIALLAAGATPVEVVRGTITGCPGRLGELLVPAVAQMDLGRSASSALTALPVVQSATELDAWVHALASGDRLGAPVGDVLETLLRDARSAERERFRSKAATTAPRMQLATVLLVVPGIMWLVFISIAHGLVEQLRLAGIIAGS